MKDFRHISKTAQSQLGVHVPGGPPEEKAKNSQKIPERKFQEAFSKPAASSPFPASPVWLLMAPKSHERGLGRLFHSAIAVVLWLAALQALSLLAPPLADYQLFEGIFLGAVAVTTLFYLARLCLGLKLFSIFVLADFLFISAQTANFNMNGFSDFIVQHPDFWATCFITWSFYALSGLPGDLFRPLKPVPALLLGGLAVYYWPGIQTFIIEAIASMNIESLQRWTEYYSPFTQSDVFQRLASFAAAVFIAAILHRVYYRGNQERKPS